MKDRFDREIDYLRISVTDLCNLKCLYCVPKEGIKETTASDVLSFEEIVSICRQAVKIGISKIKITGGEPLLRKNVAELVKMLRSLPGISEVTMTTNGILLPNYIDELKDNGLDGINISIDSLEEEEYSRITGGGKLENALKGLDAAIKSGIKVKVNSVLYKNSNWKQMLKLAKEKPVALRFIETMPIGMGEKYEGAYKEDIISFFEEQGIALTEEKTIYGNGPAVYFKPEGYVGLVGIIAPMHGKFCSSCNRIRMSAAGMLKPCLCFGKTYDIRKSVRDGNSDDILNVLKTAILEKPAEHRFTEKDGVTEKRMMSQIGG